MKILSKKELLPTILIIGIFLVGVWLYPDLPERIPSHWNSQGQVDAWSGRNFSVFFFPALILAIYLLMSFIPLIDPLRKRYKDFEMAYFGIKIILILFLSSLYLFSLFSVFYPNLNINYFIIPGISLLFVVIGVLMPKIKKNYFVGIRTAWTIHSERVWDETHKFGGKIFIAAGIVSFSGILIPQYSFLIFIISAIAAALISIIYSYFIFRKIGGFKNK